MNEVTFGIYVPSYHRAKTTTTYLHIPECTYVVRKSEEDAYKNKGVGKIVSVDDELINNVVKVNQWLIDNAKEDVICVIDDDIKNFVYRTDVTMEIDDHDILIAELERIAQIMVDLGIGYGAVDATAIPYNYTKEFDWKGSSGSTRWINRKVFKAKLDESVIYNYDIDVILQELLKNRITLKPKYFVSRGGTDTNEGGNSSKKRGDQITCIELMKKKWGKHFKYDLKHNKPFVRVKR